MSQVSFRCPECWRTYTNATGVENHRAKMQGACFHQFHTRHKRRAILEYRRRFQIIPPPLPEDPDAVFEVIED